MRFSSQFVYQFTLPEQHHAFLLWICFFHFGSKDLSGGFLFDFIDLAKGSTSKPLDYFVSALKYLSAVVNELIIEHSSQHLLWNVGYLNNETMV
jgi:hypothetical protein